jgi:hypothetical protein
MKWTVLTLLLAAGAAQGQLNRSFEFGDLTGYAIHDDANDFVNAVMSSADGVAPSHGSYMLEVVGGGLSQAAAAEIMGMYQSRLSKLYLNLGGDEGYETAGTYTLLIADLPAGDFTFDFMFNGGDIGQSLYLDHVFVVNGAGQFTVLANGLDGEVNSWTEQVVSHPGGKLYFVAANGGDNLFPPYLYIDDTRIIDTDNGSFESQDFNHWTVNDAGAGTTFVTNEFIDGLEAPAGFYYARLPVGNVSQTDAEAILGLESGRLAQLYTDLGGTGNPTAGDYTIISQPFGGACISMEVAFKTPDIGSTASLDHAFAVDSEGNITVLASTIGLDPVPAWEHKSASHSGGEFFIVVANGGNQANNATLYVDDVQEGPPGFDAAAYWDGIEVHENFGGIYNETVGQLIEPAERSLLESLKFYIFEEDDTEPFQFQAFVYEWDGARIVGDALFASEKMWTDAEPGGELVTIDVDGLRLEKYACYVAFLTTTTAPSPHYGHLGRVGDRMPGELLFNGNDEFADLFDGGWLQATFNDLAIEVELTPIFSQVIPEVNQFVEGASLNQFPWNGGGDWRYQQLYAAEQFNAQQGVIDSFAYRVQTIGDAFGPVELDVEIWMGYSDYEPGQLTTTFDDHWSFGKTLVFDGAATLSSAGLGGFDIVVDVNDVFNYDPDAGNLLVEIVFPTEGQPEVPQFDSAGYSFGNGGTPWTDRLFASSADAPTGIIGGDDGHVTRFNFVAEPPAYDPDCNADGQLNILDFVCFQAAFQAGDVEIADCDANGALNILDFVCFQGAFQAACK